MPEVFISVSLPNAAENEREGEEMLVVKSKKRGKQLLVENSC